MAEFSPKQLTQYEASHLVELQGDVSETVTSYLLTLIPSITSDSTIHDNACGAGAVTETIMASKPPSSISISATDINPRFVSACAATAEKNHWPVTATIMPAQSLTFPDDHFTHSFTNFAFHCLDDNDGAAKQVYRTLRPGGVAVSTIWTDMPHAYALEYVHFATRGKDGAPPFLLSQLWYQEEHLKKALEMGGFEGEKLKFYEKEVFFEINDLKRWAQLAWSYLGKPPGGWTVTDEERWDKTIDAIVERLKNEKGHSVNGKGQSVLRMVACIGVATK